MAKSLNQLASNLKDTLIKLQSDAYNKNSINVNRYNNLKLSMDITDIIGPHVAINTSISEGVYNIKNGEKISGGLGPDERYVQRWFQKTNILFYLQEVWYELEKQRGRAYGSEEEDDGDLIEE
jgi:hypothetical protein